MASMRHEALDGHGRAAQVGHIQPTCRQENSDAPSTHDNPRGNFRHQHAPRTWMCFPESVASMSLIELKCTELKCTIHPIDGNIEMYHPPY